MLDELERVRAYRDDVPEPDTATTLAARAELLEAICEEPRTERTDRTSKLRKVQRRRRVALAGGVAAAGVSIAGVLGFHTAAAPQSALARQMNQLAHVAAGQAWTGIPGPGQYLYTASQSLTKSDTMGNDKECTVSQVQHRQIWIATDGAGAIEETNDGSQFTSAADRAVCASAFNITDPAAQDNSWSTRFPAGGLSLPTNDWKSLSTDPRTLLKQVHQRDGGPNLPAEWFENVSDFLRESDVPAAIRAALYQATALIPGVKLLGQQSDPTGQTGLGVAYYADGQPTHELIFDQQSGRLLAEEYFDKSGKLTEWTAYTKQRIVNSVPDYPLEPPNPPSSSGTTTAPESGQATTSTPTNSAASKAPGVS